MGKPSQSLLNQAAKLFGCKLDPVYHAGGHRWSDGTVYYLSERKLMLKLNENSSENALSALQLRLQFAEYLSHKGISCLGPIHSVNGKLVESLSDNQIEYLIYAWPKLEGSTLQDLHPKDLESFYQAWGTLVGKCHQLATAYPIWHQQQNPESAPVSRMREAQSIGSMITDEDVRQAWFDLHLRLDQRPFERSTHGFIHNDPHPQNIISRNDTLSLLDFDVAGTHFFATDVAICIYSEYSRLGFHSRHNLPRAALQELFLKPFIKAYLAEYPLPESELSDIEIFLNYRRMIMFAVLYEQIAKANPEYLQEFRREILCEKPFLPSISLL